MEPARRIAAATVNPRAGAHTITGDPRELAAALRAAEGSWARFPYYEWRYGERGKGFAYSDSGWTVTLLEYSAPGLREHILWLGRVLSSRGMPQWMLEVHLERLHRELIAAVPEGAPRYDRLLEAAGLLRDRRRQQIAEAAGQSLAAEFDERVGPDWSRRLSEMGSLLVAAVVDEGLGIAKAVPSLQDWAVDRGRFPAPWIAAVNDTVQSARELVAR